MMRNHIGPVSLGMILLFVGLVLASTAMAENIPGGRWWRMPRAQELRLTDKEKKELDDLFTKNRRSMIDLKGVLEKERFEMENLIENRKLNESAVIKQFEKTQKARADLSRERFRFLLDVRKRLGCDRYRLLKETFRSNRPMRRKPARP